MLSIFPPFKTSLFFLCVLCVLCVLCGTIFSQWDKYPTYGEYVGYMEKWEEDYPQLAKLHNLGPAGDTSLQHRMYAIQISDNVGQNEQEPSFLYLSSLHGDELVGYVLLLRLADYLLTNYGINELVTKLVDSIDIWIAPLCNPDGTYPRGDQTVDYAQRRNVADNFDLNRNFPCLCQQGSHKEYGIYDYAAKETEAVRKMIDSNDFVMSADLESGGEIALYPWAFLPDTPADELWWKYVGQEYADTAQKYSPDGYFDDSGGVDQYYTDGYEVHGIFIDYPLFYRHCRNLTLRLSPGKLVPDSQLNDYWNYNYRSLLNYMKQVFYGFRGEVLDFATGLPVFGRAKVFIDDHDIDSSFIRSQLQYGDFYRPIYPGKYTLTFTCTGYIPATLANIQLRENEVIRLKVKLYDALNPYLSLASPNGGEVWERGKSYNIIWYYGSADFIQIIKDSIVVDSISLPTSTKDAYLWEIPSDFPTGDDYRIRVNKSYYAISDSTFSIIDQTTTIDNPEIKPLTLGEHFTVCYDNNFISIRYTLPYSTNVKLEAYDIKGKLVKVITDKFMQKGSYYVNCDSKRFGSGVYFIKLGANGSAVSKRVMVIK